MDVPAKATILDASLLEGFWSWGLSQDPELSDERLAWKIACSAVGNLLMHEVVTLKE